MTWLRWLNWRRWVQPCPECGRWIRRRPDTPNGDIDWALCRPCERTNQPVKCPTCSADIVALNTANAANAVDPVKFVLTPVERDRVVSDLVHQASAGAGLAHALYHAGKDVVLALPDPVTRAYIRACNAYQIGPKERNTPKAGADTP